MLDKHCKSFKQLKIKPQLKAKMPNSSINHILQPKHTILKQKDADKILEDFNISLGQLPKIKITDPAIPEGANVGDIIKIERKDEDGEITPYHRVVVL